MWSGCGLGQPDVGRGPGRGAGVGRAVNQAVVLTFLLIFAANYVITTLYFVLVPAKV